MSNIRTHQVASAAYHCVEAHSSDDNRKKYGALAHKLPGLILQNGLAQATGFLLARNKPEHLALLADLNQVLRNSGATDSDDGQALHQTIIASDLHRNQQLTRRALEASSWIKRYVQGLLRITATGDPVDDKHSPDNGEEHPA